MFITPTVKNCYSFEIGLEFTRTYKEDGKNKFSRCDDYFRVDVIDGTYVITANGVALNHSEKYTATLTVKADGTTLTKTISLPVKQGSAKVTQSTKALQLLLHDRYDTDNVTIAVTDDTLRGINYARTTLDATSANSFKLEYLGNGEYAIGYLNNTVSSGFKVNTTKTVKLSVFLLGNNTTKPNATISVKVTIK